PGKPPRRKNSGPVGYRRITPSDHRTDQRRVRRRTRHCASGCQRVSWALEALRRSRPMRPSRLTGTTRWIMRRSQNAQSDVWRILLFARNGAELLFLRSRSGFRLPELRVPRWQRIVPTLNTEAKRLWNLDTVCLFPLDVPPSDFKRADYRYHVMEVRKPDALARVA